MGNISAKEGGSVTLQCHLSSTTANVTQVNWEKQDQLLAVHHTDLGCFLWAPSLGGNMQWYLLLIWAQGLGQAPLPTSGKA